MRALIDRFPGTGPAMNRLAGATTTMSRIAEHREREARGRTRRSRASGEAGFGL
jgi:hypothetical protein